MAAVLVAWPAAALLIRPDRDDAEYLELASRYPSSIALGASAGEAALIAPRWLLTGGRQGERLKTARAVQVAGAPREIQSIHIHPSKAVALVFLRAPVERVEPAPIYRAQDEKGKTVAVAAHGAAGHMGEWPPHAAPAPRASINTIDRVTSDTLALQLKKLDEASDLQGALLPEELGAPMFIEVKEQPMVAGIALDAGSEWQTFARVSAYASWIDDAMFAAAIAEAKSGTDPNFPPGGKARR